MDDGYHDALGTWRVTSDETRTAILTAMGADASADGGPAVRVVRQGQPLELPDESELRLEDGTRLRIENGKRWDIPIGYHDVLDLRRDRVEHLIVAPPSCHDLRGRTWAWAAQVYATRSRASWGIGDLGDLRELARWSRGLGAGAVLVNPLGAPVPRTPEDASPYRSSSRRYRNPLYVRIEDVPGARDLGDEIESLARAGRALNRERRIDRERVRRLKQDALERLWRRFGEDADFDRYCADEGPLLRAFAVYSTVAERHGACWRQWPVEYRRPTSADVERFAAAHADRVRFHQWQQWLLDRQLARAAAEVPLVHDFPIGVDPDGADAWLWQDALALDASVGAPPDRYNARGQDWGLPPFVPHRLRAQAYRPFIETIRGAFRHAGGVRMDHVMGLFRLFWVPRGLTPADGAYVRYAADDLLGILALESYRARAFVVGEDLGTVEHGVRARLAAERVLSYRVLWFEDEPPARYPELALASVTTHDLPTIAGLWTGADLEAQRQAGLTVNEDGYAASRRRLAEWTGVPERAEAALVIEAAHRLLATAPSLIACATLEDALAVAERPNLPGTTADQHPNWSRALPEPLETIESAPLARAVATALASRTESPGAAPPGMSESPQRPTER